MASADQSKLGRAHPKPSEYFTLGDIYLAYRKAKSEAFYENTHFNAIAFAEYEEHLARNLRVLLKALRARKAAWSRNCSFVGGYTYAPKSVSGADAEEGEDVFFRSLDPIEEWKRQHSGGSKSKADYRLIIKPTVDFHIVSALWIAKVGWRYEARLNENTSFGNRLRLRRKPTEDDAFAREFNADCPGLFAPYFRAYGDWRKRGLAAMRQELENGNRVFGVTMDIQKFYHRVSPEFLLNPDFLKRLGIALSDADRQFTRHFVDALKVWYSETPDHHIRPQGALPIGLSASKVISNVLLAEFDQRVVAEIKPAYYGRYVDDIFLVFRPETDLDSGAATISWIASKLPDILSIETSESGKVNCLRLRLPYAKDSDLVFAGAKQKIFDLAGPHGLDLVSHVEEQIRIQSSEHRLLPVLPETGEEMASRALLAQTDASLQADALRKADAMSVRRLGISLLLRDADAYARDLPSGTWHATRLELFGLIDRHVLTPRGLFEYLSYAHRAFGLFIACRDFDLALQMTSKIAEVFDLVASTTEAPHQMSVQLFECRQYVASALLQSAIQATTVQRFRWSTQLLRVFAGIGKISSGIGAPRGLAAARRQSKQLFYSDWGRRPYREEWLTRKGAPHKKNPKVPMSLNVQRVIRLRGVRKFRKSAQLSIPYWPAVAFPTRPLGLSDITLAAPELLKNPDDLREALFSLRGTKVKPSRGVSHFGFEPRLPSPVISVSGDPKQTVHVAIPSILTTNTQWTNAARGNPDLSVLRYEKVRRLINQMIRSPVRCDYVILPELSLPNRWALGIAHSLASHGISLIAGLEYQVSGPEVKNEALLSLTTDWPWHRTSVFIKQSKTEPAYEERRLLRRLARKRLHSVAKNEDPPPVYLHNGFAFGVTICSDLTNMGLRSRYQGRIDALFALEWNQDIESFGVLVEATAQDLHAYIVQVNNRMFGDSRARVPAKENFLRDVVRVRGGLHDYFVTAALRVNDLRRFQRGQLLAKSFSFKPLPIGYTMSRFRRNG